MLICGFVQSTNILPVTIYLTNGTQLWYENDINGNRVRTSAEGSSNNFYFDGAGGQTEAVCLLPYSSNLTYNILGSGGDNIGQVKVLNGAVSGRYYYLKDHLGSIRMTVDVSGNVVGYDDYYPYGMQMTGRSYTSSADQRYKFTGKERDANTGLDYFGARYYDSWRGQWLQVDPHFTFYPSLSPYNYAGNNPIIIIDPNGMDSTDFQNQNYDNYYRSFANWLSSFIYQAKNSLNSFFTTMTENEGQKTDEEKNSEIINNHGLTNRQKSQIKLNEINAGVSILTKGIMGAPAIGLSMWGIAEEGITATLLTVAGVPFTAASDWYTAAENRNVNSSSFQSTGVAVASGLIANFPIKGIGPISSTSSLIFNLINTDFSYEKNLLYNPFNP